MPLYADRIFRGSFRFFSCVRYIAAAICLTAVFAYTRACAVDLRRWCIDRLCCANTEDRYFYIKSICVDHVGEYLEMDVNTRRNLGINTDIARRRAARQPFVGVGSYGNIDGCAHVAALDRTAPDQFVSHHSSPNGGGDICFPIDGAGRIVSILLKSVLV